jgi:hypothetical protein
MGKTLTKGQILKLPPSLEQCGLENGPLEFWNVYGLSLKATGHKRGLLKPSEEDGPAVLKKPT